MGLPFYVSPEQFMKDKSDYARKGISRGKSVIALDYARGILFVAENTSRTLHKIAEIYDRIAFAGVGKFNEFETLRMHGVRQADVRGYSYSREDVSARALANGYSQVLGQIFTVELKPFEVEILVAQVGHDGQANEMFHILYDGSVTDEANFVAMGGQSEALTDHLRRNFKPGREIPARNLELAVLDRSRERRKFRRLSERESAELLGATAKGAGSTNGSGPDSGPNSGPAELPEPPSPEPGPSGDPPTS